MFIWALNIVIKTKEIFNTYLPKILNTNSYWFINLYWSCYYCIFLYLFVLVKKSTYIFKGLLWKQKDGVSWFSFISPVRGFIQETQLGTENDCGQEHSESEGGAVWYCQAYPTGYDHCWLGYCYFFRFLFFT